MKALYFAQTNEALTYLESLPENKAVILFTSARQVQELAPSSPANAVLCSSSGEYTLSGYQDGVVTGFEYDRSLAEVVEIGYPPVTSITRLKQAYGQVKDNPNAFMLLLCDGLSGLEESIMATLYFMKPDFKIVGGSAGDNQQFKATFVYIGRQRVSHAAIFFNAPFRTALVKENIYTRTGATLLVTQADVMSRTVYSFNNRPAAAEYARVLGVKEEELPQHFINHPLGKAYEDDIFIASPMRLNPDRSITFYTELMPNTFVHMLKPEDPVAVLKETLRSVPFKPTFVLAVHCILRSIMFRQKSCWSAYDRELLGLSRNITGFVSYGEQYYQRHANQTMVLLVTE
jgi:hypothetical protein